MSLLRVANYMLLVGFLGVNLLAIGRDYSSNWDKGGRLKGNSEYSFGKGPLGLP